jgi:RNA polymerase sigma factor (TIGR02999 family)
VSALVAAWGAGDEQALAPLMSILYPDLRRMARQLLRRGPPNHSLESAALANEAYLKLLRTGGIKCENRVHFLALCSQITRRILVDHARQRESLKRGGDVIRVPLEDGIVSPEADNVETLALHDALDVLAETDPRKARVVECRYFGGLTIEETAEALGISEETAKRDWRLAKAWLFNALARAG